MTWAEQQASLASEPHTQLVRFFGERGLLAARSDWSTMATQLLFQPRSVRGGHALSDHTKIALAALGRWWSPYLPLSSTIPQTPIGSSVVTVDGRAGSSLPCRVAARWLTQGAMFVAADARLTYMHRFALDNDFGQGHEMNSVGINVSMNYFFLDKRTDDPVYDLAIASLPVSPFNTTRYNSVNCSGWQWLSDPDRSDYRNASQKCKYVELFGGVYGGDGDCHCVVVS